MKRKPFVLIITGPTASGKSRLAEDIAPLLDGHIINADMGQFYTPLTIGTAKPDWKGLATPCHLFDILDQPEEMGVVRYRSLVIELVHKLQKQNKLPIIVGGSLFYIKSLFFPPRDFVALPQNTVELDLMQDTAALWDLLENIDPVRAQALHPNDRYRIVRALQIWQKTGQKPSEQQPLFDPPFNALVISLEPERTVLYQRINQRVEHMMQGGWIEEAEALVNTPWEAFIQRKGLIGYVELITWIKRGKKIEERDQTMQIIAQQTRNYAKRQLVFLQKFKQELEAVTVSQKAGTIPITTITKHDDATSGHIIQLVKNF